MTMANHESSPAIVAVKCKCGRNLRAKFDQIGTEIRCWDCHRMVPVPFPELGKRVARELSDGALVVIQGPGMNTVFAASALVTAVLAIPIYGVWCSVLVLTLGASAYADLIRRVSRGTKDDPEPAWHRSLMPASINGTILCFWLAAGTALPLWYRNGGHHQSPHWDGIGRGIAAATWIIVPILMLMYFGRTGEDTRLGPSRGLKLLWKHSFATLLALSVIPMTLVLIEVALGLIFFIPGNLTFFALDYMPMPSLPDKPVIHYGIPYYHKPTWPDTSVIHPGNPYYQPMDYRTYPQSKFIAGYLDGLRHGYSFAGAIPSSLSSTTRAGLDGDLIGMHGVVYTIARVVLTLFSVICLLTGFAIQARWLGAIPALQNRRRS